MKRRILQAINHPFTGHLIRFGFLIRGCIYTLIGLFGLGVVVGWQDGVKSQSEIIKILNGIPFGKELLIIVFGGLVGYGLWGILRAFIDPFNKGTSAVGLVTRFGYLISGVTYLGLSILTLQVLLNLNLRTNSSYQFAANMISNFPAGYWIVGGIGIVTILAGCNLVIYAYRAGFKHALKKGMLNGKRRKLLIFSGKYGYAIQGLLYIITGSFLVKAGIVHDVTRTMGPIDILSEVGRLPGGPAIVGFASVGIIALGLYSVLAARVIKIENKK
jgi:hypothetical protein